MKKPLLFSVLFLLICLTGLRSQSAPQGINYQCIIRGADKMPIAGASVKIQVQIRAGSETGPVEYLETHEVATNDFGLANLVIGQGTPGQGTFGAVDWGASAKFLVLSLESGTPGVYDPIGASQLVSVPYALFAQKSADATLAGPAGGDLTGAYPDPAIADDAVTTPKLADGAVTGAKIDQMSAATGMVLHWDGTSWSPVTLPPDTDNDPTNELQSWSTLPGIPADFADNTDNVSDADADPTNELQSWNTLPGIPADFADNTDNVNDADANPSNEGSLSVSAGTATNAIINSNTSGSVGVTIAVGNGLGINETGNTITLTNTGDTNPANDIETGDDAGGDLDGTYPDPAIRTGAVTSDKLASKAVTSDKIDDMGAVNGKVLKYINGAWGPGDDSGVGSVSLTQGPGIGISGASPNFTIQNTGDIDPANDVEIGDAAGGDLAGAYPNPTVKNGAITTAKLADKAVTAIKIDDMGAVNGKVLKYNNGAWAPGDDNAGINSVTLTPGPGIGISGASPNFSIQNTGDTDPNNDVEIGDAAGGDLTGAYPNPVIAANAVGSAEIIDNSITTNDIANGAISALKLGQMGATNGQSLVWNNGWAPATVSGNGFEPCGQTVPERIGIGICPFPDSKLELRYDTPNEDKYGAYFDISGAGLNRGMKIDVRDGSNENDGIIIEARQGANDTRAGVFFAYNSDRNFGVFTDVGSNSENTGQNIGIYARARDRSNNFNEPDFALFATVDNASEDWAGYFDGKIGTNEYLQIQNPLGNNWRLDVNNGSNVLNLVYNGTTVGTFSTTGNYSPPSDSRWKENIQPLQQSLPKVLALGTYSYNFTYDPEKQKNIGFLAQNVEDLFPELAIRSPNDDGEEKLMLNYAGFSVVAIKAIQEQQAIIDAQQAKIESQEARIDALEKEMASIRALVASSMKAGSAPGGDK